MQWTQRFRVYFQNAAMQVCSGVPKQPLGDIQTKRGAMTRALQAEAICSLERDEAAKIFVGIEGGVTEFQTMDVKRTTETTLESFAWIAVRHVSGTWGLSRTASFQLPHSVSRIVLGGAELGEANDRVFMRTESKKKGGSCWHPHTWLDGPYGILPTRDCFGLGSFREF